MTGQEHERCTCELMMGGLRTDIEHVLHASVDRGLLFCTSHFVQDHCSIEELTFAYDLIFELVRKEGSVP